MSRGKDVSVPPHSHSRPLKIAHEADVRPWTRVPTPVDDVPPETDSAMPGSSVTPRHPLAGPNSRFPHPPRHLLPDPWSNRFPLGHPMNPVLVERNSHNPSSRTSGCFSLISSLSSKLHFDLPSIICSGSGSVPTCSPTIYGPGEVWDNFHHYLMEDEFKRVLAKIEMIYREVEFDSDELESGYCCCLGLLNPKANILVNGSISIFSSNASSSPDGKGGDMAILVDGSISIFSTNASSSPASKGGDMAQRSLDGLIAFLTCLFPYLPVAEALAYLDAVDADPLAAAALIIARRGQKNYCWMDPTTTIAAATMAMALKCGAVAAQHPNPSLLVKGWTSLSHYLHQIARRLSVPRPDYNTGSFVLRNLRNEYYNLEVQAAWELADDRLRAKLKFSDGGLRLPTGLPPVRAAMKRMLLAKIHGFYLKALCSLPKDQLTERYHRALVMGGYCYGPLQLAANIIVNMIWYEQNFPTAKRLKKITMISTRFLWQVAARSLYGLVSFLCTRYPSLTPDHAMQRLLVAEANLQVADPYLFDMPSSSNLKMDWSSCPQIGPGKDTDVPIQMKAVRKAFASILEAYTAAATAAYHPNPAAQKEFLGSPDSVEKLKHASEMFRLDDGHQLSSEEFDSLFMFLQRRCISSAVGTLDHQQEPEPTVVGKLEYAEISRRVHRFWGLHDRVCSMVLAALEKFNRTHESQYSLHVICGVNDLVSGPKFCSQFLAHLPFKYQHYHINFLATLDAQPPKLFFAEYQDDHNDTWCVPVDWSRPVGGQARCFYCESQGNRIIHPALSIFYGFDFEEVFFGQDTKNFYDNDRINFFESVFLDWTNGVEEEAIYHDYRLRDDDDGNGPDSMRLGPPPCC